MANLGSLLLNSMLIREYDFFLSIKYSYFIINVFFNIISLTLCLHVENGFFEMGNGAST